VVRVSGGLSLVLRFDGSVGYGPENADPRTAAIGYVVETGTPLVEGSRALSAFVSSTHVEFRALVAGARAVAALSTHRPVSAVHVRGDAAAVIDTVDPTRPAVPGDAIRRRRVDTVRDALADVPTVTYQQTTREQNRRAHVLAARPHQTG
jgi:ribonuclease HI